MPVPNALHPAAHRLTFVRPPTCCSKSIEHAGLPTTTPEERRRLLSFVVVGGGPTGCELAAELHDLITEDVSRLFPHLKASGGCRLSIVCLSFGLIETE